MDIKKLFNEDYINEILQENVNVNLIRFTLLLKFIEQQSRYKDEARISSEILKKSKSIPIGALATIFSDPSFYHWIYLAQCIRKRIENNEEIPISDLPYLRGIDNPRSEYVLKYHLIELNRFILAACLLSKTNFQGELLCLEKRLYIPFLGISIEYDNAETINLEYSILDDKSQIIIDKNNTVDINSILFNAEKGVVEPFNDGGVYIQPVLHGSSGKVVIDTKDPYLRLGWSELYTNPDGSKYINLIDPELEVALPDLRNAHELIRDVWPEMESNISNAINVIHVVKSPMADRHMSCTSDQFFGAILTSTGDEIQLAEAIVHEYSHNLLNVVIASGEIFNGLPPVEEVHYSPWREDARHISGVLHAVFVFSNVAELFDRYLKKIDEHLIDSRITGNLVKLRMGIEVLKEYPFETENSKILVDYLDQKISDWENLYKELDFSEALSIQRNHVNRWIKRYPNLTINQAVYSMI